ncbi:MAG: DNA-binding response regulator [Verrucomicrobia bacterium Tous-C9LFEB]|nr:MAG: DNA-binding response regulator [Verrucomicrobia bacterium Tous-C9LFEB]
MNAPSLTALVIDDEVQMRRLLRITLEAANYRVHDADNGAHGLIEAASRRPDVVVLDMGLPDMDGLEVLKRLREWSRVPIVILSVRDGEEDKVAALDAGADDYVTKPFHSAELLARLRVAQRHSQSIDEQALYEYGPLRVDFEKRQVFIKEELIDLTPTEYTLLRLLIQSSGKVLTHRQILRTIWGPKSEEQAQYLRVYVSNLRKKLSAHIGLDKVIKTESGIGYRWTE